MRGLTSTIVLVLVLAGLGGYIYFVDSKRPSGSLSGIEPKQRVFTVDADKIEEIRVTADQETSTLKKVDNTWRITEPVQSDADQSEVSSLTSNISSLEVNRVVDESAADLGQYGLADPRMKVAFKGAGGVSGEIHLGDKTATQNDLYAVKAGEKRVFLISGYLESTFNKKPFDLRDKRILTFERDKADLLEIVQPRQTIQLARSGSEWAVKQPVPARGDYSTIEGLMTRLSSATMTKLVEQSADAAMLAKYGLDKPSMTVTIGAGSSRAALAIGKEENGETYARDQARPAVFVIDPSLATDLKKPVDEYRNKNTFEFRAFNLARIRIARGADTYEFQKASAKEGESGDRWQRIAAGGSATDVDTVKMDDLLSKLSNLRIQSFTESAGSTQPSLIVSASYDEGKFERTRFTRTGNDALASREGEPGAGKLDTRAYDEMIAALDAVLAPPAPATPSK